MPTAEIVCEYCNATFRGDVPDNRKTYIYNYHLPDNGLKRELQDHHVNTRIGSGDGAHGHDRYEVLLGNGQTGSLVVNSYYCLYKAPPAEGK